MEQLTASAEQRAFLEGSGFTEPRSCQLSYQEAASLPACECAAFEQCPSSA